MENENRQMTIFDRLSETDDLFGEDGPAGDAFAPDTSADDGKVNEGFIMETREDVEPSADDADDTKDAEAETAGAPEPEKAEDDMSTAQETGKKDDPKARRAKEQASVEKKLEAAREKLRAEKAEREKLCMLDHGELVARAGAFIAKQKEAVSGDPGASGIVALLLPFINGRTAIDDTFSAAMLSGGKTFSGMYKYIYDFFYRKAKEMNDALPEKERKQAGFYGSADDTELNVPAEEYIMRLEAETEVRDAEAALAKANRETPAKPGKNAGKKKEKAEKAPGTSEADLFSEMESLFDF